MATNTQKEAYTDVLLAERIDSILRSCARRHAATPPLAEFEFISVLTE